MKKIIVSIIGLCTFMLMSCSTKNETNKANANAIPVYTINVNQSTNPEILDKFLSDMQIRLLPLETRDSMYFNGEEAVVHVADGQLFIHDVAQDMIFRFDKDGKFINRIARKGQGPEEYTHIVHNLVDWQRREVYIADYTQLKVYDFAGNYLRTLLTKEEMVILDIHNLNADQLLCARERENCETPYHPYFTLSKADGRVDTLTSIEVPRFIASNRTVLSNDGRSYNAHAFLPLLVGCADRMWLTALALDTIFQINPDRSLLPVMAPLRAPTRDEEAPLLHFRGINDRYVWLSWVRRNVTVQLEHMEAGMREDLKIYMYDRKAQTWCEPVYRCRAWSGFEPRYIFTDPLPYGYGLVMLNAMDLVEAYQNDELADERLREIASTLREDDNPVLMRLKFK